MKNVYERMQESGAREKAAYFRAKQKLPYEQKKIYARRRAEEFALECERRGLNYHVSVGGLDSIVLFLFLKSIGIGAPGVSVSGLEDRSIQEVHKALGIEVITSAKHEDGRSWTKVEVLETLGFPVISKEIAAKIELLQNPTTKNMTVRHAIITGETGEYGGWQKNSRMRLAQKWLELFGGYENEKEGTNYKRPDKKIKISSKCCYYLKEKPINDWAKKHNSVPFLGLMASEGGRREKSLALHGCNYFGKSTIRSCPFAIFSRQDILKLALEMDRWYLEHKALFSGEVESIIPEIYGEIKKDEKGELYTTGAQRTGCSMCGFGIHLEKRPHRFDRLRERNYKEWEFWMKKCCKDEDGTVYGWGRVLDYIGVGWEDIPQTCEQLEMRGIDEEE